jgi:hypothetical protein
MCASAEPAFISDLRIPEARSGRFRIVHKVIEPYDPVPVVNRKMAFFGQVRPRDNVYDFPVKIHVLQEIDPAAPEEPVGVWMSDSPSEELTQQGVVEKCTGKILVAGLGLGFVAHELSKKPDVERIDIVELNQDVINLVWRHVRTPKMNLITGDIYEILSTTSQHYDWFYFDILPNYNEDLLYTHVLPMRKILLDHPIVDEKNVIIWANDVMMGQLTFDISVDIKMLCNKFSSMSVLNRIRDDPEFIKRLSFCRTKLPFYKWYSEHKESSREDLIFMLDIFRDKYGLASWFRTFGKYIDYADMERHRRDFGHYSDFEEEEVKNERQK